MRKFGLIGKSLDHSWSKSFFSELFHRENVTDCVFENYPMDDPGNVRDLILKDKELTGLSVTIPFKVEILPYLDETDVKAAEIGAVNCLHISRRGKKIHIKGCNTDSEAFKISLIPLITARDPIEALVLGTGGAARAVGRALKELAIPYNYVSRIKKKGILSYDDLDGSVISTNKLIINATPLGMFPDTARFPQIPYEGLDSGHILYDLVYNPAMTRFLKKGLESGATIKNGLEMLQRQAEMNWKIWNEGQDVTCPPGVPPQW